MRKIIFITVLALSFSTTSFAQPSQEEFRQGIEEMETQMADAFRLLEETLQDGRLFEGLDTVLFKVIPLDPAAEPDTYPNGDPYQLHHLLDQLFGTFNEENQAELERYFKDFEERLSAPQEAEEESQPGEKQGNDRKKKSKKSKTYRL